MTRPKRQLCIIGDSATLSRYYEFVDSRRDSTDANEQGWSVSSRLDEIS